MTEADLQHLEDLAKLTSPRPWFSNERSGLICHGDPDDDRYNYPLDNPEDDDFIVAACNAVPDLITEVRRLRNALEYMATAQCSKKFFREYASEVLRYGQSEERKPPEGL